MSNVLDYQLNLVNEFSNYLSSSGSSNKTIKNYISDINNFFKFLNTIPSLFSNLFETELDYILAIKYINVLGYKYSLWETKTPISTINRRLSSVRSFFTFVKTKFDTTNDISSAVLNIDNNPVNTIQSANIADTFLLTLSNKNISNNNFFNKALITEFIQWITQKNKSK